MSTTAIPQFQWTPQTHRQAIRRRRSAAMIVLVLCTIGLFHGVNLLVNITRPTPLCDADLVYLEQTQMCVTQHTWWDYHRNM